jgi:Ca2+-binding EF-hand superfamily protein
LKEKGRTAFKEEKWDEAVALFTQVIDQEDPKDATILAIRSSAYQKQGALALALEDADACVLLQPTYVRGHIRKACVLRALKNYTGEVECCLAGLVECPNNDSLTKGLQMAKRLKTASSKAGVAAKTTHATWGAAISRQNKANNAKDIASFVSQTKMNLELQMVALQAQLDLVHEMASMTQEEKIDMLYQLLTATGGMNNLKEVVEAVKKASGPLPFGTAIQKALALGTVMEATAGTAATADVPLNRPSFENWVHDIVGKVDSSLGDFAEFVVYQVLFTGVAEEMKKEDDAKAILEGEPQKSILYDPRMQALFVLFDKDADSTVDFKEVAIGLYPLTNCMEESSKNAAALLLMMDKDDQRVLDYERFAKLMLAAAAAFGITFDELADQLTLALANQIEVDADILAEIMVAEEAYTHAAGKQKEEDVRKKTVDALSYSRTQKLFGLWDADGDGTIDFQELLTGLRRYQKSAMGSKNLQDVERDALMIMGHDQDSNQALDQEEFAYAMANYAEAVGTSLHDLIDFMCVVSSQSETVADYEAVYEQTITHPRSKSVKFNQLGTILDAEEDSDAEEDDW